MFDHPVISRLPRPAAVDDFAGFVADDVVVLSAVFSSEGPQSAELFTSQAKACGIKEGQLVEFRRRVGRGEHAKAWARVHSLGLRFKDGLLVDGMGRVLLPVEAFGAVIDVAAVAVFLSRDTRRSLNPEAVLEEISKQFIAGGRNFGAVHSRHVEQQLVRASLDGDVPSLSALLRRIELEYDALAANFPQIDMRLRALYMCPRPKPADVADFAAGRSPCLIVPASSRVLLSLPLINSNSSCFSFAMVRTLPDGCESILFTCSRARGPGDERFTCSQARAPGHDGNRADGAATGSTMPEMVDDDEGSSDSDVSDGNSDGGGGGNLGYADVDSDSDEGSSGSGELAAPPSLSRSIFASAASGVQHSSAAIERAAYGVSCNASLYVFKPALGAGSSGASWLLVRGVDSDGIVVQHAHALNEYLPPYPALEIAVKRELVENGTFTSKSRKVSNWLAKVLVNDAAEARKYAASGFRNFKRRPTPTINEDGVLRSPTGARPARGHFDATADRTIVPIGEEQCVPSSHIQLPFPK